MIFGIGTDIVEIRRITKAMSKNPGFAERLFTEQEMEYYRKRKLKAQHIAGGFSAKEAVLKALGTGLKGFRWKDIEILRGPSGKPMVRFGGSVRQFVSENGIGGIHVTISHSKNYATATAVAEVSIEREGITIEDLIFQADSETSKNIH